MKPFTHTASIRLAALAATALLFGAASATAAEGPSFKGKTVNIILGTTTGGTTDFSTRLMAASLGRYLPGKPEIVVQNKPGAHGITAMNYFTQQATPNGLSLAGGSNSQISPLNYRIPQSHYDPTTFHMVGGVDIGGTIMIVRTDALARLTDKSAKPVTMGSVAGYPQSGMQMTAWGIGYLGWNAKWVPGYHGLPDLILALKRGEVEMTSFATTFLVDRELLDKKRFAIIYQSGSNGGTVPAHLPEVAKTPIFRKTMEGKIGDAVGRQAFDFWRNISSVTVWIALPPKATAPVVATYRAAFAKAATDKDLLARGEKLSKDFSTVSSDELTATVKSLSQASPAAVGFMTELLRKEGLNVERMKKKSKKKKKK